MHRSTDVVNNTHNPRRVFTLDELADDLVVEVVDLRPFDSFANVFLLQVHKYAAKSCDRTERSRSSQSKTDA